MYSTALDHELFYFVQPGDSLWRIAQNQFGLRPAKEVNGEVQRLLSLNPHIKDPNRIFAGDLLLLGSPARQRTGTSMFPQDLVEAQKVWRNTSAETKETIRKNFDIIDWLSDRNDEADFLDSIGQQTASVWRSVSPYATSVHRAELIKFSQVYEELLVVRNQTIALLSRYRLSVERMPIFLVSVRTNGFYGYAQKLARMIELADKFRLGKILLAADILLEAGKVARVAIQTRDAKTSSRQAAKSTGKVLATVGGGVLAARWCKTLVMIHKVYGSIGCAILIGVNIWPGQKFGETVGETLFDSVDRFVLPRLP